MAAASRLRAGPNCRCHFSSRQPSMCGLLRFACSHVHVLGRELLHFSLHAGGFNSVPHVYIPLSVCVRALGRVLCSVSCALIILPGVVAEQQIIHGPATQAEDKYARLVLGYLRGNDLCVSACLCVHMHKFESKTTEWEETLRYVLDPHANTCSRLRVCTMSQKTVGDGRFELELKR